MPEEIVTTEVVKPLVQGRPYELALTILADEVLGTLGDLKVARTKRGVVLKEHAAALEKVSNMLLKQLKLELEIAESKAAIVQRQPDEVIAGRLKAGLTEKFPVEVVKAVLKALGLPYVEG
jgi:hypothetical protein